MITVEQRGEAIKASLFVRDAVVMSMKEDIHPACPDKISEVIENQLALYKSLGFICNYQVNCVGSDFTFRITSGR